MEGAYFELIAYDGIEHSIDQAYRAYLDAKLVELAHASSNENAYWTSVRKFRTDTLDPGTRPEYPNKLPNESTQHDPDIEAARVAKSYELGFLYWFDVRARFWGAKKAAHAEILEQLEWATLLRQVHAQVSYLGGLLKSKSGETVVRTKRTAPQPRSHPSSQLETPRSAALERAERVLAASLGTKSVKPETA